LFKIDSDHVSLHIRLHDIILAKAQV